LDDFFIELVKNQGPVKFLVRCILFVRGKAARRLSFNRYYQTNPVYQKPVYCAKDA
jgi:hypothetical protein